MSFQAKLFGAVAVAAFAATSPAQALTPQECSAKYQAAKTAGTLAGQKWNDFRKAQCGADATAAPATTPAAVPAAPTEAAAKPKSKKGGETAAAPAAPAGPAVFPSAVDPKYSKETAGKARMHTCVDQYNAQYRELLELPMSPPVQRARIDRLIVYTDFAQNSLKVKRYEILRATLRKNCPRTATSSAGVYLRRGRSGELRLLENEAQIEEVLASMGFDIIDPMVLSAADISSRTLGAPLVISVEGSHLSHAIFSASDTATFVVLQPPYRLCMTYKEYTDQVGSMRFAFLVGDRSAHGFRVEPDHLERLLDLVATAAQRAVDDRAR